MSEGDQGVALMVILAVVSGLAFHWRVRAFQRASVKAAAASTVAWAVIVLGILGETDSLILIALMAVFFWSFLIACGVGLPFWWHRKYEERPRGVPSSTGSQDANGDA